MINSLPDDVLLRILGILDPFDITRLRQVSNRFNALTGTHSVWLDAYQNPSLFAAPISVSSISTAELERHVVQSAKLQQNWDSSSPTPVISKTVYSGPDKVNFLHLFYGRYLIVGLRASFLLYDLEGPKDPLFKETHQDFRYFTPYCAQRHDAYCVDSRPYLTIVLKRSLDVWELCLGKDPPMRRVAQINDGHAIVSDISQNYIYFPDSTTSLFHVPTQRMYKLDTGLNDLEMQRSISLSGKIIPGRVLVTRFHLREQMFLHCFDLPEPGDSRKILKPTHNALLNLQLAEISLIFRSPPQLKVLALGRTVDRVCWNIIPEDDGTITIQPQGPAVKQKHAYNLHSTANGYGKARAVVFGDVSKAPSGYTVSCDGAGEPIIETRPLHGLMDQVDCIAFDGYKGRLCTSGGDHRTVQMFDYVRW